MACKYILYITLLSENRHKSSQFKYKHRFKIIANNSYRMYINILVLHGNTCFICAMVKLECLEQMIQLQRYVSEMDFFVQEWHPCKGYGPVNSTVENGVQFPTNGCQSL